MVASEATRVIEEPAQEPDVGAAEALAVLEAVEDVV
jgi:hypothetical protein